MIKVIEAWGFFECPISCSSTGLSSSPPAGINSRLLTAPYRANPRARVGPVEEGTVGELEVLFQIKTPQVKLQS